MADLHTHIIPRVDDGAPDLETALESLELMYQDGVTAVTATPHLNASKPEGQRRQRADRNWPALVRAAADEVPGVELYRGFEVQLDIPDPDLSDEGLRINETRFALVEWHAFTLPTRSAEILGRIRRAGYVPILVHPERYFGYDQDYTIVPEWRDAGALLQLNSGSLLGEYGERIQRTAKSFVREGWIDLIASDNHARPGRRPSLRAVWEHLAEHGLTQQARLLLSVNPRRILRDEMPLHVGPLNPEPAGWLTRVWRNLKGEKTS